MVKFIYFDIGGVVLDWEKVFTDASRKFNLDTEDIGVVFDENHDEITKGIMGADDLWKKCIQRYSLKNASDFDFLESWVSDYKPIKQTHEFIKNIHSECRVGLLSNIYKGMLPILIKKEIIPNINYDRIILSCDIAMMKPDPDIYEFAQRKSGFVPNEILLIDDRKDYLDGADKLGWNTFLFETKDPNTSIKGLEKLLSR